MRKRRITSRRAIGLSLLGVVVVLGWGCASTGPCQVDTALKRRLDQLVRETDDLEKDPQKFDLYQSNKVIRREVSDIGMLLQRLKTTDDCKVVTDEAVTVLERRLAAVQDALLGNCLEAASQKRVDLINRGVTGVKPKNPTDLASCIGRLKELDAMVRQKGGPQRAGKGPCAGEPASLDEVREAESRGDETGLSRLTTLANRRLGELSRSLSGLIEAGPEPSPTEVQGLEKEVACAGAWILALRDRPGLEERFGNIRHRLDELGAHRAFFTTCVGVQDEADRGALDGLDPGELERRRSTVHTLYDQLSAPSQSENELKSAVLTAIDRAEEHHFRQVAQEAISACDRDGFETALGRLKDLGRPEADFEEQFRTSCAENVAELARRLETSLHELERLLGGPDLAAQDRAMEAFLADLGTVDSLSADGRERLGQRIDLNRVVRLRGCAEPLLEGDRALDAGDATRAQDAYRRAGSAAGCRVGRFRKFRLDRQRARLLRNRGDLDGAWSLLAAVGAREELVALAQEGVRKAPAGSLERLRWLRRLRKVAGLSHLSPAQLLELSGIAANQAGNDSAVWGEAWAALSAYFKGNPVAPPIAAFVLASRVAHVLDVSERGWASGSWRPGGAPHIDRFVAWCEHYGPRLGADMAARLKYLISYQEVLFLARQALESLWDEVRELDPSRQETVRAGVLRRLLAAISKVPLVRDAGLGGINRPGAGRRLGDLVARAMANELAVSGDSRLVAASAGTPWGRLVMVFDSGVAASAGSSRRSVADRLAVARAEALGTVAGLLVEMTSGRTDLSIAQRKGAVGDIIEGLRYRMGENVLAYAGLFNRDGALEVPRRPGEFFLDRDLARVGVPVFQDTISRKAVASEQMIIQRYTLEGRVMADVAVPIRRGRNRLGVLRLGVRQSGPTQR